MTEVHRAFRLSKRAFDGQIRLERMSSHNEIHPHDRTRPGVVPSGRVRCGLVWAIILLFLVETAATVSAGWATAFPELAVSLCVMGGSLLCAFAPGVFTLARHGGRYDWVVACFSQTLLAGITAIGAFTCAEERVVWLWDHPYARYAFFGLATAAAILVWLCALVKPAPSKATAGKFSEADKTE